jgi:MFS family permease
MIDAFGRYRATLSTPGAWGFFVPGIFARFPIGMTGISILLYASAVRHDYSVAGALSAASAIGYAVASPQLARLSDRIGQRRVLLGCAAVCAVSGAAFVISVHHTAVPLWALFLTAATMGASTPAIGSMIRARWSALLDGSTLKMTAFAFESVVDEAIFIVGPVVATLLATTVNPVAGLIGSLVLVCGGSVLLSASERTEPPRKLGPRPAGSALFLGPVAIVALVNLCCGGMWGSIDIATVTFSAERHHPAAVGVLLAVYAIGASAAGAVFGGRDWAVPLRRVIQVSMLAMAVGILPMLLVHSIALGSVVLLVAGVASAPATIAAMSLVADGVPAARRTEAMAWQSTALWLGVALGSSAGGHIAEFQGAGVAYAFAAACGGVGFAIAMAGNRRMTPLEPEPEEVCPVSPSTPQRQISDDQQ